MRKRRLFVLIFLTLFSFATTSHAQTKKPAVTSVNTETKSLSPVKTSPAYAEVLLRKTELISETEALLIDYTEDFPKVKEMRYEIGLLQKELDKLLAQTAPDSAKFSTALGKLMVRKCELGTDLWKLQDQYNDQHPDVKRAKRRLEIYDAAINDILK